MRRERNDWLLEAEPGGSGETLMSARFRGYLPVVLDVETGGFNARSDALLERVQQAHRHLLGRRHRAMHIAALS